MRTVVLVFAVLLWAAPASAETVDLAALKRDATIHLALGGGFMGGAASNFALIPSNAINCTSGALGYTDLYCTLAVVNTVSGIGWLTAGIINLAVGGTKRQQYLDLKWDEDEEHALWSPPRRRRWLQWGLVPAGFS